MITLQTFSWFLISYQVKKNVGDNPLKACVLATCVCTVDYDCLYLCAFGVCLASTIVCNYVR